MKRSTILIVGAMALSMNVLYSCSEKPKEFNVADYVVGNDYYIDTICKIDSNAYCLLGNPNYGQVILYDNSGIIAYNPLLSVDSIEGTTYNVSSFLKSMNVDFADSASIAALKEQYKQYADFNLVCKGFDNNGLQPAVFGVSVDEANDKLPYAKKLNAWIAMNLGDTIAALDEKITADSIGHRLADGFFANFDDVTEETETEFIYTGSQNFLIYEKTDRYITYMDYMNEYTGGAHGMYSVSLVTYSIKDDATVDNKYLFKPGSANAVQNLLCEAILNDKDFMEAHNVANEDRLRKTLSEYLATNMPQPAVTSKGIVYCFQPYDIGSYAEGEYDFFISFDHLQPYFTEQAQKLIR